MCTGVLAYESDGAVADLGLYKEGAIAVLSCGGDSRQHRCRLALLPSADLAGQPLPAAALNAGPLTRASVTKPPSARWPCYKLADLSSSLVMPLRLLSSTLHAHEGQAMS